MSLPSLRDLTTAPNLSMIDLRYVKKLIEMLDGSTVDSVEISSDKGMKIRISKTPQQRGAVQIPTPVPMQAMVPASSQRLTPTESMPAIPEPEPAAPASRRDRCFAS